MNQQVRKWLRYAVDFSAPLAFAGSYFLGGRDLMLATGVSIVVGIIALVVGLVVERRVALLPLFVLAVILCLLYEFTGSIWACISVHFLFNAATVTIQLLTRSGIIDVTATP